MALPDTKFITDLRASGISESHIRAIKEHIRRKNIELMQELAPVYDNVTQARWEPSRRVANGTIQQSLNMMRDTLSKLDKAIMDTDKI